MLHVTNMVLMQELNSCSGITRWLGLLSHSKSVLGSNSSGRGLAVLSLYLLPMCALQVLQLPPTVQTHALKLTGDSKTECE